MFITIPFGSAEWHSLFQRVTDASHDGLRVGEKVREFHNRRVKRLGTINQRFTRLYKRFSWNFSLVDYRGHGKYLLNIRLLELKSRYEKMLEVRRRVDRMQELLLESQEGSTVSVSDDDLKTIEELEDYVQEFAYLDFK